MKNVTMVGFARVSVWICSVILTINAIAIFTDDIEPFLDTNGVIAFIAVSVIQIPTIINDLYSRLDK